MSWDDLSLKNLINALNKVDDWEGLGIQLDIEYHELQKIFKERLTTEERKRAMLQFWLENDAKPSWETLLLALSKLNLKLIADEIKRDYQVPSGTQPEDDPPLVSAHPYSVTPTGTHLPSSIPTDQPEESLAKRVMKVRQEIITLVDRYDDLVAKAGVSLSKRQAISPEFFFEFRTRVSVLPTSLKYQHRYFLEHHSSQISKASTVDEIFSILNNYCNFLNCGLLAHVIRNFGDEELQKQLSSYMEALQRFRSQTKLTDFFKAYTESPTIPPESVVLVTKMGLEWEHHTLEDAEEYRKSMAEVSFLADSALYFKRGGLGSIYLVWSVLNHAIQFLAAAMNSEFLQRHSIVEVTIDGMDLEEYRHQHYDKLLFTAISQHVDEMSEGLIWASQEGCLEDVVYLLSTGVEVNSRGQWEERTALMAASRGGFLAVVKKLLRAKASVNLQDEYGWTALMEASCGGHTNVVRELLSCGAQVDLQDEDGETALTLASDCGHVDVVQQLLSGGIQLDSQDEVSIPRYSSMASADSATSLMACWSAPALPTWGNSHSFSDIDLFATESHHDMYSHDWMRVQELTFTNWFNDRLRGSKASFSGSAVSDLSVDLKDGTLLIKLLENLTNKKIRGYEKAPKITAHKMVNLDLAFTHMRNEGIKLTGIGSQNVYQGDLKLILGLVWTLIQKYQLRMKGTQVSTKALMIQWLQALLPTWNITNLTTDWNDGRCLMALINEVKPGVGPDVSTLDPTKHKNNCTLAIQIARNHIKIPALIAPENLSNPNIDDLSVMTYLSYFCDPAQTRLLKWVRRMIPSMTIHNLTTDWLDGRAFAALIDACFPGTFPDWTTLQKETPAENINKVFSIARKRLGIQPNFTAAELANAKIEKLKVITYILRIRNGQLKALPEEILVSGPGILKATAGRQTHFEIDTTQAGRGRLYIDAFYEDGKKVKFSLHEKLPGIVTLTYTPEEPGTANFNITWSDIQIPKSPFSVEVTDSALVKIIDFEHHERLVQVNTPIKLKLNTKSAGQGIINAHLKYDKNPPIHAKVSTFSDSTATLEYTPPKAGNPVLHVFWNGEKLTHLTITYTVVDNQLYRVSSMPEENVYRTFEHTSFSVQSQGLPLEILQMTAILGDVQIPITFKTIEGNVGHASFTPTLPGVYNIEVACINKLVQGSPFTVKVADPSRCKLLGSVPKYLKFGEPHEFRVNTKDAGVGEAEFQCTEKQTKTAFRTNSHPLNSDGLQLLAVTPLKCGEFLVGIKFHDSHIPGSPFRVVVCDPSRCQVIGDLADRKTGIVGNPIRFKIIVSDASEGIKPAVKAIGPSAKYSAEIRTTDDKTYAVQFTPWEIGTHEISITYGSYHIPHSPFLAAVMGFDSNICSASGTGLQEALTGVPSQFMVLAKQSNLLEDGTLEIRVAGVVNKVECKVRIRDNKNGTYNVAYMTQIPGAYLITVLAGGQHIPGSPFRLTAQPGPKAEMCRMYGPALDRDAILTIGKPIDFTVDTAEAGKGQLTVKAVGPQGAQARVFIAKGDTAGIHDVKLDPVRHGKYRVSVKWSGRHIPGSPFLLKIFPGADASKCKAFGPGLEDGFVGQASTFTIETRDAGAGTLKVRLHGVKDAFKIEIKPCDQRDVRTLQARYDPRKPGEYLVTIRWSDVHVPGSPFRVKITGEAINDDSDECTPTPRDQDLPIIAEEDEEDEHEETRPKTEKKKENRKKNNRVQFVPIVPVSMVPPNYIDPRNMPIFNPGAGNRTPYQVTFMPPPSIKQKGKGKKPRKELHTVSSGSPTKGENSTTSLPPMKMMTFSNLQQVHKHTKSSQPAQPIRGMYHGHAAMQLNTVTRRSLKETRQLTKTVSDSVLKQKRKQHH